nr:MAG TPA: hypothetical protein [Caudoviricetes sp.]
MRVRRGTPEAAESPRTVIPFSSLRSRSSAAAAALSPVSGLVARVLMSPLCHIGHQGDGWVTDFGGLSQGLARCPYGHLQLPTWTPQASRPPSSGPSKPRWRPPTPPSSNSAKRLTSPAPPSNAGSEPDAASSSTRSTASPPPSEPPPARSSPRQKPPNPLRKPPCATPPPNAPSQRPCPS